MTPSWIRMNMGAALLLLYVALGAGCADPDGDTPAPPAVAEDEAAAEPAPEAGIPVPPGVRENLGIHFVPVERRAIAETRRTPGAFELLPGAHHEYRVPLRGRVVPHVELFQEVQAGDLLISINSPQWRQLQHEAVEAEGEITMAEARRDVSRARLAETRARLAKLQERLENLAAAGARNAALESEAAGLRESLVRLEAESREQDAAVREAHEHYESRLRTLASVTGIPEAELTDEAGGEAAWHAITALEIHAAADGRVASIEAARGAWLEEGDLALATIAPERIQFHAEAPQSDIALYRDGQRARIVPPQGGGPESGAPVTGTLQLGLTAKEAGRTLSLFVRPDTIASWTRAGVAAYLEVTLTADARESWAIPRAAVLQDGLEHVFFRRDPENPDRVLRVVADLGEDDGRWVALRSGVKAGDEIVLDGAYALKLASGTQQAPEGYHYHADGSLHPNH